MSGSTYSLDALVQEQLDIEQQKEEAAKVQRESEKQQVAGGIVTRVRKLLDNDDLDGLKALDNGTLPPDTVPQADYDQLQKEKAAADQKNTQLTTQVAQLQQEIQQLKASTPPPASSAASATPSGTGSAARPQRTQRSAAPVVPSTPQGPTGSADDPTEEDTSQLPTPQGPASAPSTKAAPQSQSKTSTLRDKGKAFLKKLDK